jgi:hypothetical protein
VWDAAAKRREAFFEKWNVIIAATVQRGDETRQRVQRAIGAHCLAYSFKLSQVAFLKLLIGHVQEVCESEEAEPVAQITNRTLRRVAAPSGVHKT